MKECWAGCWVATERHTSITDPPVLCTRLRACVVFVGVLPTGTPHHWWMCGFGWEISLGRARCVYSSGPAVKGHALQ